MPDPLTEFFEDLAFVNSKGQVVDNGIYSGSSSFMSSEDMIVNDGKFSGFYAFAGSKNSKVYGGEFLGPNAFYDSENIEVYDGLFYGQGALSQSQNSKISGGYFPGLCPLEYSDNAKVIAGAFTGESAFHCAKNLQCYMNGTMENLGTVISGIVVVRRINYFEERFPSDAEIYAAELGPQAQEMQTQTHRINLIDPRYFDRKVDFTNLKESLAEVVNYTSLAMGKGWPVQAKLP